MVSSNVNTCVGSRILDHAVNPQISANMMVTLGKNSAMGAEEETEEVDQILLFGSES
jgi:hypothetical protein